jgi:RHS repeat-associated protein
VTYSYDSRGFVASAAASGIGTFTYNLDSVGRVTGIKAPDSGVTTITYDSNGRPLNRKYANGTIVSMSYDPGGRLTTLEHLWVDGGCMINQFKYSYNKANMRTGMTDLQQRITTWTYDPTYQLTREQQSAGLCWNTFTPDQWFKIVACDAFNLAVDAPGHDHQFSYDAAGNLSSLRDGTSITTFTYATDNTLQTSVTGTVTTTYSNDGTGQRIKRSSSAGTTVYTWTDDHRLASVQLPGHPVRTVYYTYDANGMLTQRILGSDAWRYTWEGNRLLAEHNSSTSELLWYTRVPRGYGELIGRHDSVGGTSSYPLPDALGSARKVFGAGEQILQEQNFAAFGNMIDEVGGGFGTVEFAADSGYYRDPDTGLYYLRQRWYDPDARRFLSPDPVGRRAKDVNLFRYAGNNPINMLDPEGLDYLEARQTHAYWNVQHDAWGPFNPWIDELYLGEIVGVTSGFFGRNFDAASISLTDEFGGGIVKYNDLKGAAGNFWNQYSDMSSFTHASRQKIVRALIGRLQNHTYKDAPSSVAAVAITKGFFSGAAEGATIFADELTFEQVRGLHEYADSIVKEGGVYAVSKAMGIVFRECVIDLATMGAGAYASGSATVLGKASPVLARVAEWGARAPRFAQTSAKGISLGLRAFQAGRTVYGAGVGVSQVRAGNPWGWVSIGAAGVSGFTASFGGFGMLRKIAKAGAAGDEVVHLTDTVGKAGITASKYLKGNRSYNFISALHPSYVPKAPQLRRLVTWSTKHLTEEVRITGKAAEAFDHPVPMGIASAFRKYVLGVRATKMGVVDMAAMEFRAGMKLVNGELKAVTRWDVAKYYGSQAVNYWIPDAVLYAAVGTGAGIAYYYWWAPRQPLPAAHPRSKPRP